MVRIFIFVFFAISVCYPQSLEDKIINIIGEKSYDLNRNFIDRIFAKKQDFYTKSSENENILDSYKIIKTLKANGLLKLVFDEPADFKISFMSQSSPIFLIQAINSALSSMGYSYFVVSKALYVDGKSVLEYTLSTEYIVDPVIILNEFKKRGFVALDVVRDGTYGWSYDLKLNKPMVANAKVLKNDARFAFKNIVGEYWFDVGNMGSIKISARNSKVKWYPRIALYDKDLKIVEILTQNKQLSSFSFMVGKNVRFVMVTDFNNPSVLKGGIDVEFKKK